MRDDATTMRQETEQLQRLTRADTDAHATSDAIEWRKEARRRLGDILPRVVVPLRTHSQPSMRRAVVNFFSKLYEHCRHGFPEHAVRSASDVAILLRTDQFLDVSEP